MSADFWAGYLSGAAGIVIGNPLDLVKTRLQAGQTTAPLGIAAQATSVPRSFKEHFDRTGTLARGETCPSSTEHDYFGRE
jgi:solute carrier family 25 carnitine/acylcarnitine transporter 20/29